MAIYSLHHQPIGKSTQARPHTSAAHVRYITRPSAASRIDAERMPKKPGGAATFMVASENADRKNARASDKLMLALPRELDAEQRAQLVRGFAEDVTRGRAPWLAAFHDQGKDAHNPHAHLVIRDRDPDSGRRVAGLSEKGSTDRLRALWETHANRALEKAGRSERIDRRTLEEQGIRREPTVHEGPKAQQMDRRGARPESRRRRYRNRPGSRLPYREVDYRHVDGGRSRPEHNRSLRPVEVPTDYWEAVDADSQRRELEQLRSIHLRHRPDLLDIPLVARPVEPGQRVNNARTGVGFGRSFAQPEAHEQGPEFPLPRKPENAPLNAELFRQRQVLIINHESIYADTPIGSNNKMNARDDDSPEARWKSNDAQKRDLNGKFEHLLDNSYEDKKQALDNMREYQGDHGNDGLFHALRTHPEHFGAPPKDPSKAADAPRYQKELAPTFHDYGKNRDDAGQLRYTHGDPPQGGQSPANGHQPPSSLTNLYERPQPSSMPPGGASGIPQQTQPSSGQQAPTSLGPSSSPLESPYRAEGRPQATLPKTNEGPGQKQQPKSLQEIGKDVHNPWENEAKPQRNPLASGSPPLPRDAPAAAPKAPATSPEPQRHPLASGSPNLPRTQPAAPAATPAPVGRDALKTPVNQPVRYQKPKGLDDGR